MKSWRRRRRPGSRRGGAVLCAAQAGNPPSGTPAAKMADETVQPATPPAPAASPQAAPPAVPQSSAAESALPPKLPAGSRPPADAKAEQENKVASKYVIGPLDVLYVRVWNQPNLSGILDVGPDGIVSMALIGELKADGLTVTQLKDEIAKKLSDCCLNTPDVSVAVTKINSKSVLLIGGVGHPGRFPLTEKTTVLDAIVGAGGIRDTFANSKKIYVLRGGKKIMFNYKDVIQGKHPEQNIELQNGDQIVVPE